MLIYQARSRGSAGGDEWIGVHSNGIHTYPLEWTAMEWIGTPWVPLVCNQQSIRQSDLPTGLALQMVERATR